MLPFVVLGAGAVEWHSVKCEDRSCVVKQGDRPGSDAIASWEASVAPAARAACPLSHLSKPCHVTQDGVSTHGWARLLVRTAAGHSDHGSDDAAFGGGYLEGYLSAERIVQHLTNIGHGANRKMYENPNRVADFIVATDDWTRAKAADAKRTDPYWSAVRFLQTQMDGLRAGVNARLEETGADVEPLSRLDVLRLSTVWENEDISLAVNATAIPDFQVIFREPTPSLSKTLRDVPSNPILPRQALSADQAEVWVRERTHCSMAVKLTHDGSELYIGHNTWGGYHMMLRVHKRYEFGRGAPIAMSSYPGALVSGDDFFQVGNLTVTETTLPSYNHALFGAVTPKSVPYWIRAMVANQQATSGAEWMEAFARHNSGTYNNAWIVVDFAKFIPGKPLREGLLTVGEQLPEFFHYEDATATLSYGYYPSYNAAVYPETARRVGQDAMVRLKGERFSYQMAPRAQIFRRDQTRVRSDADMQQLLRYNQFESDPVAKGDPCKQLACRADLNKDSAARAAFGALDAKYTSSAHVRADRMVVISSPTYDDQPPFEWSRLDRKLEEAHPHEGHPDRFRFPWLVVGGNMEAAPYEEMPDSVREPAIAKELPDWIKDQQARDQVRAEDEAERAIARANEEAERARDDTKGLSLLSISEMAMPGTVAGAAEIRVPGADATPAASGTLGRLAAAGGAASVVGAAALLARWGGRGRLSDQGACEPGEGFCMRKR